MTTNTKRIEAGQTLTARSVCDHDCIFTANVISRSGSMALVKCEGREKRCKVYERDGEEFIMPMGRYSMAPVFKAR